CLPVAGRGEACQCRSNTHDAVRASLGCTRRSLMPPMNRRHFIRTGAAGLGAAALGFAGQAGGSKPLRVGMIGSGWDGKCDLFRLIQVAPVEVVSLCDVDRRMLSEAADLMSVRQASHKKPRTYTDY